MPLAVGNYFVVSDKEVRSECQPKHQGSNLSKDSIVLGALPMMMVFSGFPLGRQFVRGKQFQTSHLRTSLDTTGF
jgi:hypothetical protein